MGKANFMKQLGIALARELAAKNEKTSAGKKGEGDKKMKWFLGNLENDFLTQTLKEFFASLDTQRLGQTSL